MKGFLGRIFTKNKIVHKETLVQSEDYSHLQQCAFCKSPIFQHEQKKTYPKSGILRATYHIKCFRKSLKECKRKALYGESTEILTNPIVSSPSSL